MTELLISVTKANKFFKVLGGWIHILKDIDINVNKGEFIAILGPSGSGKTSILNILMGFDVPEKGSVKFGGTELTSLNSDELAEIRKQKVGIIYQNPVWIESLTVIENIALPLVSLGYSQIESNNYALEILKDMSIDFLKDQSPSFLSSGEQQKVALARAIVTNPDIIFADEPTGNLDYNSGLEIMQILKELNNQGKTIIVVTHDLNNLNFVGRMVRIFDGKIVEDTAILNKDIEKIKLQIVTDDESYVSNKRTYVYENPNIVIKKNKTNILETLKVLFLVFLFVPLTFFSRFFDVIIKKLITDKSDFLSNKIFKLQRLFDKSSSISFSFYIKIALANLLRRLSRSFFTIGGIALSISLTVFLISLGFGLERLVISESSNNSNLNQFSIFSSNSNETPLTAKDQSQINNIKNIQNTFGVVSLPSKVSVNNFETDFIGFGVESDYLKYLDLQVNSGNLSLSNSDIEVKGSVIVNQSLLNKLNTGETNLTKGSNLLISFLVDFNKLTESDNIQTNYDYYKISSIIDNGTEPFAYFLIEDLKSIGIENITEIVAITNTVDDIPNVRDVVELLGYRTKALSDEITGIRQIFSDIRSLFIVIGIIALSIASLGMFNTLIVSFFERTREIGLFKAIGVNSNEILKTFLSEAAIISLLGSFFGILTGLLLGSLFSLLISILSVEKGFQYISLTYLPPLSALQILLFSLVVGLITGIYPSIRAKQLSVTSALKNS